MVKHTTDLYPILDYVIVRMFFFPCYEHGIGKPVYS